MVPISVNSSKILIGDGLIDNIRLAITDLTCPCNVLIVSDSNVSKFYVGKVKSQLDKLNFEVYIYVLSPGEQYKSLNTIEKIYAILSQNFMSRCDAIVAIGGGIVTDVAGFAAATYNRGMKLIFVPTSLLAMIDASIGGKNGVNSEYGKNLIGTFYNPKLILIDPEVLKTLPQNELHCGIAEAIKYGCIKDEKLLDILENSDIGNYLNEIIYRSIMIKKEFVEKDEFDLGYRMHLNFGHTIGHAIERLYNYEKISHGQAVSIGMNIITKISEMMNLTQKGTLDRLSLVCKKYSLLTGDDLFFSNTDKISEIILHDKKILDNYLNLVLLKKIGESFIYKISSENIVDFIKGEYLI